MPGYRDLRNQSRDFDTAGNQFLLDLDLNAFGMELFVESYWDTIEKMVVSGMISPEREPDLKLTFTYRGMTITLDPSVGLAAWERPTAKPESQTSLPYAWVSTASLREHPDEDGLLTCVIHGGEIRPGYICRKCMDEESSDDRS